MHHQRVLDWLHHLPTSCDRETHLQLSPKLLTPPPSIEASIRRKRRMEEEPDNGGAAEEVTPRPKKKRRNRDDVGPSRSPNLRRRRSVAATSHTPSETSSISTSSTTTSRGRRLLSDIAAHLEVSHPTVRVGPTVLTTPPQVKRIYTLLDNPRFLTQYLPNIPARRSSERRDAAALLASWRCQAHVNQLTGA